MARRCVTRVDRAERFMLNKWRTSRMDAASSAAALFAAAIKEKEAAR